MVFVDMTGFLALVLTGRRYCSGWRFSEFSFIYRPISPIPLVSPLKLQRIVVGNDNDEVDETIVNQHLIKKHMSLQALAVPR